MTDDLNDLMQALNAATPDPDPAAKAKNLALAQKTFTDLQGSRDGARHTSNRPNRGFWTGALKMLNSLTSRAALTATTAVVAIGFVMLTPIGSNLLNPPKPLMPEPLVTIAPEELERDLSTSLTSGLTQERTREPAIGFADTIAQGIARGEADVSPNMAAPPETFGILAEQGFDQPMILPPESDSEAFANEASNPLRITAETPVSTFSIDVDTASYSVIRNSLMNGRLPDPQSVRIEEMINYFPYAYPAPEDAAFQPTVSVSTTPWNRDTMLVHIGIQGALPDIEDRPPLNLVFLIDTSGSMNQPNKLPLLKQSFRL